MLNPNLVPSLQILTQRATGRQAGNTANCIGSLRLIACSMVPTLTHLSALELTGLDVTLSEGDLMGFVVSACLADCP